MENNTLLLTRVESIESTEMVTEDVKILQSLNVNLQVKVHNLETEVDRLKKEVQNHRGKSSVYDSLTKDLASLRKQFDKTAVALLKKCEAHDALKKEVAELKSKAHQSPRGVATPIRSRPPRLIPVAHHLKSALSLYRDPSDMDSDDDTSFISRSGRPSMGSCGSIATQIAAEEAMPSCLKAYAGPSAPLRNRLLAKLHSIKSASTESLESTGRKSIRQQEGAAAAAAKTKSSMPTTTAPIKKPRTILNTSQSTKNSNGSSQSAKVFSGSSQSAKGFSGPSHSGKVFSGLAKYTPTPPPVPAYRPALGQSNGQRMVKIANISSVKRSNSNCSTKSVPSSRPIFRF